MIRKDYPKALYKGNSAHAEFEVWLGDEQYTFQAGDIVRIGIKKSIKDTAYILQKDFEVDEECTCIDLGLTVSETANIEPCNAIFEIALKYNSETEYKTIYQEGIELKGVVIDE